MTFTCVQCHRNVGATTECVCADCLRRARRDERWELTGTFWLGLAAIMGVWAFLTYLGLIGP